MEAAPDWLQTVWIHCKCSDVVENSSNHLSFEECYATRESERNMPVAIFSESRAGPAILSIPIT